MAWEGTRLVLLVVCLAVVCSNDTGTENVGPMVTDKVTLFTYSFSMSLMLLYDVWNPSVCENKSLPKMYFQYRRQRFFESVKMITSSLPICFVGVL